MNPEDIQPGANLWHCNRSDVEPVIIKQPLSNLRHWFEAERLSASGHKEVIAADLNLFTTELEALARAIDESECQTRFLQKRKRQLEGVEL